LGEQTKSEYEEYPIPTYRTVLHDIVKGTYSLPFYSIRH